MNRKMITAARLAVLALPLGVLAATLLTACQDNGPKGACHIYGTVGQPELSEGKRIFLVPLYGPKTAEYVDSIEIKDGKFEFATDSVKMFKILLDYHYRFGFQQLLVVAEPGDLYVNIDTLSHASGTPQNDSLQKWKDATETHNRQTVLLNRAIDSAKKSGNTAQADSLQRAYRQMHLAYKQFSRQLAANMKEGVLHDFLDGLFPLTYKRKMPDGTIVEMDADTNEPINK